MIKVIAIPVYDKHGRVVENALSRVPEAYQTQAEKLEALLREGYRILSTCPLDHAGYQGIWVLLQLDNGKNSPQS